jgi:aryl-alcohol dehydrogenase-like predicted oxidoreductase
LKLDRIDLYQLHAVDPQVPIEDSVGALVQLQQEGKIGHIGLSNVTLGELDRAQGIASIVSVQNLYNVAGRSSEDVLVACEARGLAFMPWFPLGSGTLARQAEPLQRAARAHGATLAQVALAWLLGHSPVVLPIPGTSSIAHFEENLDAAQLELDQDEIEALNAVS